MTILKRQFYGHEVGMGDEDWHYLVHDTDNGRVFVYHEWSHREWSHRRGHAYEGGNEDSELDVFLSHDGTAQTRLRELIGTLVQ